MPLELRKLRTMLPLMVIADNEFTGLTIYGVLFSWAPLWPFPFFEVNSFRLGEMKNWLPLYYK